MNVQVGRRFISFVFVLSMAGAAVAQQVAPAQPTVTSDSILQRLATGENPLVGSVPSKPEPGPLSLTLLDAIDRGLKYNLGLVLSGQGTASAQAARLRAQSALLPKIDARVAESVQQINLAAYGFPVAPGSSGIIGPFGVFDTRATLTSNLVDIPSILNRRAADENLKAAKSSYQNTRDLVVLVVGASYLQVLADQSRVEATQAQFDVAERLYKQAVSLRNSGVIAGIDVLRSQVEMQAVQQRLLVAQNDLAKHKLSLGRVIGLSGGQEFTLADKVPFAAPVPITFEDALKRAYEKRSDYQQAQAQLRSAELAKRSAQSERLPSLGFNADYGVIGRTPGNSHGTFTTAAALKIPVFEGGRIKSDIDAAESIRKQREATVDDLRQRIEYEVRTAFLDVDAATKQLEVAQSALELARQQVAQSRDRFAAGVTNNVEVVQAQESQATAEENYINSLFAHNLAKLSLARALGVAEDATKRFLGGKQ